MVFSCSTVQFFRIKVTGYRLLTTALVLGLGIPKAVLSYTNSKAPTTFDWIIGTVIFLVYVLCTRHNPLRSDDGEPTCLDK
jgi:hypothetical protein